MNWWAITKDSLSATAKLLSFLRALKSPGRAVLQVQLKTSDGRFLLENDEVGPWPDLRLLGSSFCFYDT